MNTWVSILPVGASVARQRQGDLQLALYAEADLRIAPFEFDPAETTSQLGKAFTAFLARQAAVAGMLSYDMEGLRLIEFAPAHFRQILALAEVSSWHSALPLTARADIVGDLLNRRSWGSRIELCAPQTRSLLSIAQAMFSGKVVDLPIARASGARAAARDEELSLGIPSSVGPDGAEALTALLWGLSRDEPGETVRVYATAEFFSSAESWRMRDIPGVALIEGMSPDSRGYAGGDFLLGAAADIHQLNVVGRDAAAAGAALLIVDRDPTTGAIKVMDCAGKPVSLPDLRTKPEYRAALHDAFDARAARVADESKAAWRALLSGKPTSAAKERSERIVEDAVYAALTDSRIHGEEKAIARAFLLAPASAQRALDLAGALVRADCATSWPLIALANRLARVAGDAPLRPSALDPGGGRLFAADEHGPAYGAEQRRVLHDWLDELKPAPSEAKGKSGSPAPFPRKTSDDGVVSYSVGIFETEQGQRIIAPGGALLFLKHDDQDPANGLVVELEVLLIGEEPTARLEVEVSGSPAQTIDLMVNARRRIAVHAEPPAGKSIGLIVKLTPDPLRWAQFILVDVGVREAYERAEGTPEALVAIGFDALETLPLATAVISGAFGLEQDGDRGAFRWISRELIVKLPGDLAQLRGDEGEPNAWLILKLRPNHYARQAPLAGEIDLYGAGGEEGPVALRRLGAFGDETLLGAPLGPLEGGVVRILLRGPNDPLSPMDSRLAAACLTDMWIASPSRAGSQAAAPRFIHFDLANEAQFAAGWYPLETVKGLASRWMAREALLSSGFRPSAEAKIFLTLAGPSLSRDNPALSPFAVRFNGRPMAERARTESADGWALLFEGEASEDAPTADFELTAESARILGPADPREASILANFAMLINPAGDAAPAPDTFGDAEVVNGALTVERWGGGLSGAWLAPATLMVCARSAGTGHLVIEGSAATDVATVKALAVEIDGKKVNAKVDISNDGSWTLRADLGKASLGGALLLRLTAPRQGRVMLRRVGFE